MNTPIRYVSQSKFPGWACEIVQIIDKIYANAKCDWTFYVTMIIKTKCVEVSPCLIINIGLKAWNDWMGTASCDLAVTGLYPTVNALLKRRKYTYIKYHLRK